MVVRFLQPYYPNLLNGADTKQSWVQAFMQDLNKVNREANEKSTRTASNKCGCRTPSVDTNAAVRRHMVHSWNATDGKPQSNTSPINFKQDDSNEPPKSWASMVSKLK